jgi:hypothetical protein
MKNLLKYGFILVMIFGLSGCKFIPNKKTLEFVNGGYPAKIIIIDNKKNKIEYKVEPEWGHMWSEDIIGDFKFIYIKNENDLEGIFIISNKYDKKLLPFDIIPINEYAKRLTDEFVNNKMILSYGVVINIFDDIFEIKYNESKFNMLSYFSYDENYLMNKEKYMKEYDFEVKINIPGIMGTYINIPYLDQLSDSKSHTVSINKVHNENNMEIDEIIISEGGVLFIYNLHEGVTKNILGINDNILVFSDPYNESDGKIIFIDNDSLIFNDITYKKVTNDITPGPGEKTGVKTYITTVVFGDVIYTNDNGDEFLVLKNGNILYKNKEFEINYGYLLENKYYDKIKLIKRERHWPHEDYWIKLDDDEISVYVIQVPDDYDDIDWAQTGNFILVDRLKKNP